MSVSLEQRSRQHDPLPRLMSAVVDGAPDAVLVLSADRLIIYANDAAATSSGFPISELVGSPLLLLHFGTQDTSFYDSIWERVVSGGQWNGVLVSRRKTGELYDEDTRIHPVQEEDGEVLGYIVTKRHVTPKHDFQPTADDDAAVARDGIIGLMDDVHPGDTVDATASNLCHALTRLQGIDASLVGLLQSDGAFVPISAVAPALPGYQVGVGLPLQGIAEIIAAAQGGAWSLNLADDAAVTLVGEELAKALRANSFTAIGVAAIRGRAKLVGALVVLTRDIAGEGWMKERLNMLRELGAFAGTLLGEQVDLFTRQEVQRSDLRDIIDGRRFHPVFQPVIDLQSWQVRGYEALTRFDDGLRPDLRFESAHAVGMGAELEAACATSATRAVSALELDGWLSLNFSAAAVIDGHVQDIVHSADRPIVIEITEHDRIENYPSLRKALRAMGSVQVSVDDAGAGFASLRHIVELEPDIVKLDMGLIRGIDTDPARQALVAGMCHFADTNGTLLVAEGVETDREARTVRGLGVHLAQGFLFGRLRKERTQAPR